MKIYVVTQGEYADNLYIITATTNELIANEVAEKFNAKVEVYDNAELILMRLYCVAFDSNGDVARVEDVSNDIYEYHIINKCRTTWGKQVYVSVIATDVDQAVKIAKEQRAKFLIETGGVI